MWLGGGLNPEGWFKLKIRTGQIIEGSVRDDEGKPQGTVLLRVLKPVELDTTGHCFTGEFLTASDPHYRWWMKEGEGKGLRKSCHYHSCGVRADQCPYVRGRSKVVHLERIRVISSKEWKAGIPEWCFKQPCKKDVEAFHDRFKNEKEGEPQGILLPWAEAEVDDESSPEESEDEEDDTAAKIAKLKAELKELEAKPKTGKDKKKEKKKTKKLEVAKKADKEVKRRKAKSSGDSGSESQKKKKKKKAKKDKKAKRAAKGVRSSSDSKEDEAAGTKKRKREQSEKRRGSSPGDESDSSEVDELFQRRPSKKSNRDLYPKHGDRGPFGAGVAMEFDGDDTSESDAGSVFRDAPAPQHKSGQLALITYSHRKPGRLAARLLMKMRNEVAMGAAGAPNDPREKTPPTGVQYLLTILLPQLGSKANLRTQRELRTLMVSLDLLARNCPARAADVICQRVKALEKASNEGSWTSAQFLELIPSENASLLERDEEVFINKEALLEQKLKKKDQAGPWKGGGPRPDRKGEKGRGKGSKGEDGQKGRGKDGDKAK